MLRGAGLAALGLCLALVAVAAIRPSATDGRAMGGPLGIEQSLDTALDGESASQGTRFGYRVALSADGDTALVGAKAGVGKALAWVFTRSGETWSEQGPPLEVGGQAEPGGECEEAEECEFARSVALSGDGDTALIGAPTAHRGQGAVWVFTRSGETWTPQGEPLTVDEETSHGHFGASVALSADGGVALIGAGADEARQGGAWVFTRAGESWIQQARLRPAGEQGEARFGHSVALSADGQTALVGGPGDDHDQGAAWVFTGAGEAWLQQGGKLTGGEEASAEARFGSSVALSAFGNTALVGGPDDEPGTGRTGAAWVFAREAGAWARQGGKLTGGEELGNGGFGASVALSADGEIALIGGPGDDKGVGAVWAFTGSGGAWTQQGEKLGGVEPGLRDGFGASVALSAAGTNALVGGPAANKHTGAVWAFLDGSVPAPTVTAVHPSSGPSEGGTPVRITGSGFLAGATVQIGGGAGSVRVLSETELTAVTTAHAPGEVEVVVSDEDGRSTGGPMYTFEGPPPPTNTTTTTTSASTSGGPGSTTSGQVGVLGVAAASVPTPQLGRTGNLTPVSGTVLVKLPGAKAFVLLTGVTQVPFGTIVNATHGKVTVTTMGRDGELQSMTFYAGEFELTQNRNGLVVAALYGGDFSVCPTRRERSHIAAIASSKHASGKHVVRKLWAEGHGSYSTKGNYASGAVLGTRWLTEDLCEGTLIYVSTDRVAVTNLVNHRHKTVKAGHSYLAKAP